MAPQGTDAFAVTSIPYLAGFIHGTSDDQRAVVVELGGADLSSVTDEGVDSSGKVEQQK